MRDMVQTHDLAHQREWVTSRPQLQKPVSEDVPEHVLEEVIGKAEDVHGVALFQQRQSPSVLGYQVMLKACAYGHRAGTSVHSVSQYK